MNTKLACVLSGMLTLAVLGIATPPSLAESSPTGTERSTVPLDLKLNSAQRSAIQRIGGIAIDQLETLLDWGLNPEGKQVPRVDRETQADLRQVLQSLSLDNQQKGELRGVLRGVLQQVEKRLETALPQK